MTSAMTLFQIRSHSEVPGRHEFAGDTIQFSTSPPSALNTKQEDRKDQGISDGPHSACSAVRPTVLGNSDKTGAFPVDWFIVLS